MQHCFEVDWFEVVLLLVGLFLAGAGGGSFAIGSFAGFGNTVNTSVLLLNCNMINNSAAQGAALLLQIAYNTMEAEAVNTSVMMTGCVVTGNLAKGFDASSSGENTLCLYFS